MSGQWQGSTRRDTLPPDWKRGIRPTILTRDGNRCTWLGPRDRRLDGQAARYLAGNYHDSERCTARATDVDHIDDSLNHSHNNLRSLCDSHHTYRSSGQGNAAKARMRGSRLRPPRPHPGLREPHA